MTLQYPEAMQDAKNQFTAENPVQVSPDSQNRDYEHYEKDTDTDADHAVYQAESGFSKAVEYAAECCIQVQKRADIGHGMDIKKNKKITMQNPPSSRQYRKILPITY